MRSQTRVPLRLWLRHDACAVLVQLRAPAAIPMVAGATPKATATASSFWVSVGASSSSPPASSIAIMSILKAPATGVWRNTTVLSGGRVDTPPGRTPPGCAPHLPSTSSPSNNSTPSQQPPAARRADGHDLSIRTPGPIDTCMQFMHAAVLVFSDDCPNDSRGKNPPITRPVPPPVGPAPRTGTPPRLVAGICRRTS
jgi:hypothetical protein